MTRSSHLLRRCQIFTTQAQERHLSSTSGKRASTSPQRHQTVAAEPLTEAVAKPFSEIPGPLALPMLRHSAHVLPRIGNFHHVVGLDLLEGLRERYGDLVRLAKGSRKRPVLYVFDPNLMRQVYESDCTETPRWDRSPLAKQRQVQASQCPHNSNETKNIWPALRTLLQDGSFLSNYDEAFDDIAADVTRRLGVLRHTENALNEEIETEVYRWSLESLGVMLFGRRIGCLNGIPSETSSEHRKEETTSAEKLVRCSREIADCGYLVRTEGTLKTESKTFNSALEAFDRHFNLVEHFLGQSLQELDSDQHARPEMMFLRNLKPLGSQLLPLIADVLLAGIDSLSHSALAMLYQFSLHAARQQRAHDELAWKAAADDVGASRPAELPYLAACAKEALRLNPATGGVVRRTNENIILAGYEIPVGVDIVLAHGVSSRSEKQWARARTFVPERWYSQGWEPVQASKAHPVASLPFGTTCPAGAVVRKLLGSLAARVVGNYRLEWHGPAPSLVTAGVNRLEPPYYFVLQNAA